MADKYHQVKETDSNTGKKKVTNRQTTIDIEYLKRGWLLFGRFQVKMYIADNISTMKRTL
jgi:hypothetical protein